MAWQAGGDALALPRAYRMAYEATLQKLTRCELLVGLAAAAQAIVDAQLEEELTRSAAL